MKFDEKEPQPPSWVGWGWGFSLTLETSMVHVPDLCKEREQRLLELSDLKKSGLSSREICDQLNSHGKTTFSGKAWTPKLVFMNLLKWEKRQNRFSLSIRAVEEGWIKTTKKMGRRS